jgi:uncharacterized protein YbaR (Trm112 family)
MESVMLDNELLDILVCPASKAPLFWNEKTEELICPASALAYPVRDGIPVLLEEAARAVSEKEIRDLALNK